jgi:uncharacterized protein YjiS (DUF1127 family)
MNVNEMNRRNRSGRPVPTLISPLDLIRLFSVWGRRSFERRKLRELDRNTLNDIGISRAEVVREAEKPFWRE